MPPPGLLWGWSPRRVDPGDPGMGRGGTAGTEWNPVEAGAIRGGGWSVPPHLHDLNAPIRAPGGGGCLGRFASPRLGRFTPVRLCRVRRDGIQATEKRQRTRFLSRSSHFSGQWCQTARGHSLVLARLLHLNQWREFVDLQRCMSGRLRWVRVSRTSVGWWSGSAGRPAVRGRRSSVRSRLAVVSHGSGGRDGVRVPCRSGGCDWRVCGGASGSVRTSGGAVHEYRVASVGGPLRCTAVATSVFRGVGRTWLDGVRAVHPPDRHPPFEHRRGVTSEVWGADAVAPASRSRGVAGAGVPRRWDTTRRATT
jgi:hypothetical protein